MAIYTHRNLPLVSYCGTYKQPASGLSQGTLAARGAAVQISIAPFRTRARPTTHEMLSPEAFRPAARLFTIIVDANKSWRLPLLINALTKFMRQKGSNWILLLARCENRKRMTLGREQKWCAYTHANLAFTLLVGGEFWNALSAACVWPQPFPFSHKWVKNVFRVYGNVHFITFFCSFVVREKKSIILPFK